MTTIDELNTEFIAYKKRIKVIFLDFDGVLNNQLMYTGGSLNPTRGGKWGIVFDNNTIRELERIVKQTGAYIVVSSSWRHGSRDKEDPTCIGLKYIRDMWEDMNMPGEVIDITPYYWAKRGPNETVQSIVATPGTSIPRGYEIQQWLRGVGFSHYRPHWSKENGMIESYVILDDDADMLLEQKDNFVKTKDYDGLNTECADKAIKILNTKI
ncbi:MAG: HAD domain-containing protein [Candidatus Pacearchaeota archaeon]|jgi:hypothetical protein|nr:HAD domain-containing protein [Clostridia bacterium]